MTVKKRGLGKGLSDMGVSELLNEVAVATSSSPVADFKVLPIDCLQPGQYQPRRAMGQEGLEELANSIRTQGIIQPLVVRPVVGQKYEIIAGERRWRAAALAGLTEVPVIIRDIPDQTVVALSLIENIQRQDLNAIEEALALQRLLDEFQMTHQAIAEAIGKSRASVTNTLRLLKLNSEVRILVEQGHLEMGHARALLALDGKQQSEVASSIVTRSLTVRETEKLVRQFLQYQLDSEIIQPQVNTDVMRLQNDFTERLGSKVTIKHHKKGKGKLVIHYKSTEELEGILDRIK